MLQAYKKLIEHLMEEVNRNVVEIQYDELTEKGHKFYVTYEDEFVPEDEYQDVVTMYMEEEQWIRRN